MTTTNKVKTLLTRFTKTYMAEELSLSRPTLDSRLSGKSKWKGIEKKWIDVFYTREQSRFRVKK